VLQAPVEELTDHVRNSGAPPLEQLTFAVVWRGRGLCCRLPVEKTIRPRRNSGAPPSRAIDLAVVDGGRGLCCRLPCGERLSDHGATVVRQPWA
jgi:hypothetical protein